MSRKRATTDSKVSGEGSAALPPLPPGWCWAKVHEVGEVKLGRQRSPEHHHGPHMRPYLRVANVYEDRIDLSDVLEMNFTPQEFETYRLRHGDILLNEGQSLEWVGRPAMYRDDLPGACFQNTLVRFRPGSCVLPGFALLVFRYYLHSQRFQKIAKWTVNIAHLGASRFAELEFPLPPRSEQARIVEKSDELFTKLDAGIASLNRAKIALSRYRAGVLKAAVEGKLTEVWRAKNPTAESSSVLLERILTERRRRWEAEELARYANVGKLPPKGWKSRYKGPALPDTADVPSHPAGWCVASIDQLCTTLTSGSRDWSQYYGRGSGTFIMAQNVRMGRLDLSYRQLVDPPEESTDRSRSQVVQGDILITIVGANTGDACRVPSALAEHYVCQSVALARPVLNEFAPFIEKYIISDDNGQRQFRRYTYGAGRPHLSFDQIKMTAVLIPPLDEQHQIIAQLDQLLTVVDKIAAQIKIDLMRASRLRQSILKRVIEGRIVSQNPADIPACSVLARILAQTVGNGQESGVGETQSIIGPEHPLPLFPNEPK